MATLDSIIDEIKTSVNNNEVIHPATWLDRAGKLNALRDQLDIELYNLEHDLAVMEKELLKQDDMTSAKAKALIKAEEKYRDSRIVSAKISQVKEFIMIAKKFATLTDDSYKQF